MESSHEMCIPFILRQVFILWTFHENIGLLLLNGCYLQRRAELHKKVAKLLSRAFSDPKGMNLLEI